MVKSKTLMQGITLIVAVSLLSVAPALAMESSKKGPKKFFQRIASFPVFLNTNIDMEAVAEIVDSSSDGKTLVYTDGATDNLGFVDISDPAKPKAAGIIAVGGEPTSVAVTGKYALVGVNTSSSFVAPSGKLVVINIKAKTIVREMDLGGQPDSVAVSHDGRFAAIVIENERDEDLGNGEPPQQPSGFLQIVDLVGKPSDWMLRPINLEGVADLFADDPEPEYVDINKKNQAVVTLQENNHIVLIDLPSGSIIGDFTAGSADLEQIDTLENDLIELSSSLNNVPREPDGVSWINNNMFATADEGDLFGGSRGFTIYDTFGNILYSSANSLEHEVVRLGHYPEGRSENKGNEPENIEFAKFGSDQLLFVASERASVIYVFLVDQKQQSLTYVQTLPSGVGPEGIKAIPNRDLLIAACEEDSRDDKIRSTLTIYQLNAEDTNYPTVISADRNDSTPIPWGALSGLANDTDDSDIVYAIHDSFYQKSRIYPINIVDTPAQITGEIIITDDHGALSAVDPAMVNADSTVNLDLEGIASRSGSGFWLVSEGKGTVGSASRPFETLNLLLNVTSTGTIEKVVTLPNPVNDRQVRFGYEGVASVGKEPYEMVYVAFQREWTGDPGNHVRIGRYEPTTEDWTFYYYPLDTPLSANGGWVGISELTSLGDEKFAVVERDNQAGPDAIIKRIYQFSIAGLVPIEDDGGATNFPVVAKELVHDLMPELKKTGGLVLEKIEGMTVLSDGTTLVVNDNDGVDDSNGETQLFRFMEMFQ
jgi:hypothetical protein